MQIGICVFSVLDLSPDYINVWCGTTLTLRSAAAAPRHWAAVCDRRHLQRGANIAAHTTRAGFTGDKLPIYPIGYLQCYMLLCRYISIWCDLNTTGHVAVMLPNPRHVCSHCVLLASYLLEENQWWGQNLLHLNVASLSISGKGKMNCDPSLTFRKHFWNLNKRRLYQSGIFSW